MLSLFGTTISGKSIALSLIHNAVEVITMVGWLALALDGKILLSIIVLAVGLTIEHILALAVGKVA